MSYKFLDRLLSAAEFRKLYMDWAKDFKHTLSSTEEDQKTLLFLRFIKKTIYVKERIQEAVESHRRIDRTPNPVSYTHLTLPTNREV